MGCGWTRNGWRLHMSRIAVPALAVIVAFGVGMLMSLGAKAAMSIDAPGMTGMEIHLKTDTKNLPVADTNDAI
jgi:hypothetical protein